MPYRVLVVEDNDDLRAMFRDALSIAGYVVTEAADGLQALRCLDNDQPDLVVLDLRVRHFSGVEICDDFAVDNSKTTYSDLDDQSTSLR